MGPARRTSEPAPFPSAGAGPRRCDESDDLTALLERSAQGERGVMDRIVELVYDDLRLIARRRLRAERAGHTLSTTAVVHEAYMELARAGGSWRSRAHFFAVAARVIRNVLVDYARRRGAKKRGGERVRVPLAEDIATGEPRLVEILAVDQALTRLARHDPRLEQVVECRFFGGMTSAEAAEALGVGKRTVERDWLRAKAYLFRELGTADGEDPRSAADRER